MDDKELLQSYKLTISTINTATEQSGRFVQRFIARLIELMNNEGEFEGAIISDVYGIVSPKILNPDYEIIRKIRMPLRSVMLPGANNWSVAKKSIKAMQYAIIDHVDKDPETGKERWQSFQFLGFVDVTNGVIDAIVHPKIWKLAKDFSMGFRAYEINKLFGFKSLYAMKFYPLLSRQESPLIMSIDNLKVFLGVENKYKGNNNNFIKKCIIPAQEELSQKGPYSFKYELLKSSNEKGRPSISAIKFYPYKVKTETEESKLLAPVAANYLSRNTKNILMNVFNISNLNSYQKLFTKANEVMDIDLFTLKLKKEMEDLKGTYFEIENPAGWYIYRLTDKVKELIFDKKE